MLITCYLLLLIARRQDVAHFTGQAKQSAHQNNKAKKTDNLDTSRFASETAESERDSLAAYKEATANATKAPQIVIEPPVIGGHSDPSKTSLNEDDLDNCETKNHNSADDDDAALSVGISNSHAVNGGNHSSSLLISSSSSSSSSSATSPSRLTPENSKSGGGGDDVVGPASSKLISLPSIPPEVMRTASERHQKGLMSPYIYQILTQGEIKLPVLMEDENHKEFPSIHVLYRPVRQMVYAILFNLHHYMYMASKNKEKGEGEKCDIPELRVIRIGWGVPTIQRLWFGSAIDDKRRRLRAFLTCMRSDTPLMLNPAFVPQHLLVMATVLRYIMSFTDKKILRKPELDAFIAQAFSPELMNAHYLQELQLPVVTSRGVQLAALFMQGVETALLANDACGAPIPWLMCCPWLFFDGKLFHHKLARTGVVKNLLELCDHHIEHVVKVERMRKAVLEGLNVQFARPPLPQMQGTRISLTPSNVMPAGGALVAPRTLPVGRGGGSLYSNANGPLTSHRGVRLVPPQVTSVGGLKTYRQGGAMPSYHVGAMGPTRPTFHTRGSGKVSSGAGRAKKTQAVETKEKYLGKQKIIHRESEKGKGRGMTVEAPESGTFSAAELLSNDMSGAGGDKQKF
ncbi:hypothetical protein L9F63_026588 [Diploptera punctata]|uniref:Uncharacterized protein n=1 Tax=Diploptera punctata TaxID=6984 RepID=A0AAD8AGT2_DIPPU|nr:hypothetical protein L9F63_026588 [Diploptera punctata]